MIKLWIMFHEHFFLHTHIVPPHVIVCERHKMWIFCVCEDHVDTCHNYMWVYKWYMPPIVCHLTWSMYHFPIIFSYTHKF